jgi:hypothetical protein
LSQILLINAGGLGQPLCLCLCVVKGIPGLLLLLFFTRFVWRDFEVPSGGRKNNWTINWTIARFFGGRSSVSGVVSD